MDDHVEFVKRYMGSDKTPEEVEELITKYVDVIPQLNWIPKKYRVVDAWVDNYRGQWLFHLILDLDGYGFVLSIPFPVTLPGKDKAELATILEGDRGVLDPLDAETEEDEKRLYEMLDEHERRHEAYRLGLLEAELRGIVLEEKSYLDTPHTVYIPAYKITFTAPVFYIADLLEAAPHLINFI